MHTSNLLTSLFIAMGALAQAVPEGVGPDSNPPPGCEMSAESNFTIGVLKGFGKRDYGVATAQQAVDGYLVCSLNNGILHDQAGRTGSVVANRQFQFDGPPQAGAIYTGGFSICANSSLALGGTTRWWQCSSGAFFNLYDQWIGDQCEEIRIQVEFETPPASSAASTISMSTTTPSTIMSGTASSMGTLTPGNTSTMPSSRSITGTTSSRPTGSGSSSSPVATQNTDAPPANVGAGAVSQMQSGAAFGAVMAIVGAALLL